MVPWWSIRPGPAGEAAKRADEQTPKVPLFPIRDQYRGPRTGITIEAGRVVADAGRSYQRIYYYGNDAHRELAIIAAKAGLPYELLRCPAVVDGDMVRVTGPNGSITGFFKSDSISVHQLTYNTFARRENAFNTDTALSQPGAPARDNS